MRRDESDASFEYIEGDTRLDACPLDSPADSDAVIAVDRSEQRRLPRAVRPMNDPALTARDLERDALEHAVALEKYRCAREPNENFSPRGRPRTRHRRVVLRGCHRCACGQPLLER